MPRLLLATAIALLVPAATALAADTAPPTITVTQGPADGATVHQGDHIPFNWQCQDAVVDGSDTSGMASCNADPADGVLDTSTVGDHTVRFSAVDNAGNRAQDIVRTIHVEGGGVLGETDSSATRLVLPSTAGCLKNPRSWRIKVKGPVNDGLVRIRAYVNGHLKATAHSERVTNVVVHNLPRTRFTLKIAVLTAKGKKLSKSKQYRVCS
jgi:hypothetical protein